MPGREIFWNITLAGEIVLYVLAAAAAAAFFYGIRLHWRRVLSGKEIPIPREAVLARLRETAASIAANRTVRRHHPLAGAMHLMIMWGTIVLFMGTVVIFVEYDLFQKLLGAGVVLWKGGFFLAFELVTDIFGALLILGTLIALARRYIMGRVQLRRTKSDLLIPLWFLIVAATGFMVEGARLAAGTEYSQAWSPVGRVASLMFPGADPGAVSSLHTFIWWLHALLALSGIGMLPYVPKVMHLFTGALNLALRDIKPRGRLSPLDVEGAFERDEVLGVDTLSDMTRKDILDLAACTECGRCELNCPAAMAGKTLSPREVILGLRSEVQEAFPILGKGREPGPILETRVDPGAVEACTTCMACAEVCPAGIDPLGKILELRRCRVMIKDRYPENFAEVFLGTEKRGNPWNEHPTSRLDWANGLDIKTMEQAARDGESVDYLLWVGCSAAFDARNQKIARSIVRILNAAGVSFAVLGEEERCTGDPARRMGHEYLFQLQAEANIELLDQYSVERILTLCPHCYNTLRNEYPDFGGRYRVIHHTEFILELLERGRIHLERPLEAVVTFHDSCYLGRYNGIYRAPRAVLARIPGVELVEMERRQELAMCCGGGGGLTWLEEEPGRRVNERRARQAREALDRIPGGRERLLATACPFCMTMMEDALAAHSGSPPLKDRDLAELVAESMGLAG